ncbi:hypothetical protein BU24DRAFT_442244 [Aaosphaeria arxii CBS 175.79]|uniref:DUF7702 domain-containing protein n=1 Tax=Aaosphaeria arxii CBS 175.79 TaxID=1450172 RepID=A0A6A5XQJ9_9PLEO|nr:uncharacterized protein BU24DRAFT_442244 [Aaosphaeria arxii CBS 175.79]KAF2015169.1 hypothetical protein BU24DRAFT_442244 [Aaosphaeria arxii CBS 175.79]
MGIRYPAVVNIITLIFFFVYFWIAAYLCYRHGLGHNTPWICIIVLCLCRLTQVSLDLAATQLFPPFSAANTSLESGVAILTEMGLTPLFMATTSMLNTTSRPKGRRMQWILLILHVPLIVSFILIVAGGIDPDSRDTPTFASTEATKAGIALYCACFVVLIWATAVISSRLYLADSFEVKILTTVVLSLPFFLVDVVYMMCFAFESLWGSQTFNVISGDVTTQLCMQVIMEYIIVALYLAMGLELPNKVERAVEEVDPEQLTATFLWKLYEVGSSVVAFVIMPALQFAHWLLGRILRS